MKKITKFTPQKLANEVDGLVVEVTVKKTYWFPPHCVNQFNSERQLINEWFKKHPMHSYHATREASEVGGSEVVTKTRIFKKKS